MSMILTACIPLGDNALLVTGAIDNYERYRNCQYALFKEGGSDALVRGAASKTLSITYTIEPAARRYSMLIECETLAGESARATEGFVAGGKPDTVVELGVIDLNDSAK